ncbi:MAG: electron transport complex subunit RsxG [Methylococcaceae bacterium]
MNVLTSIDWKARWAQLSERLQTAFADPDRLRQRLDYQTYALAVCALIASLLLGIADLATRGAIAEREAEDLKLSLDHVIPAAQHDNALTDHTVLIPNTLNLTGQEQTKVYKATRQGEVTAVAFRLLAGGGYAGSITLMLGIDREGRILGVSVLAHTETPGLGDKIETAKSDWIHAFAGRSLENTKPLAWRVKKDGGDFDQFAGATITPRAVVKGVASGLAFFAQHQGVLLAD